MFSSVGVPRGMENYFSGSSVVELLGNTAFGVQLIFVEHFVRDHEIRTNGWSWTVCSFKSPTRIGLHRVQVVKQMPCETFFSPSILNTGNSKNNFNESKIKKLSTSLSSVNCDTQTHKHTDTHLVVKLCGAPPAAKCRVPGIGGLVSGSVATSV